MDEGIDFVIALVTTSVLTIIGSFVLLALVFSFMMYSSADKRKVEGATFGKCLWAAILWGILSTVLGVGLSFVPPLGIFVELFMFLLGGPLIVQAILSTDLGTSYYIWILGWVGTAASVVLVAMVGFSIAFGGEAVAGIYLLGGIITAGILFTRWLKGPSPAQRKSLEAKKAASKPKTARTLPPAPKVKPKQPHMEILKERLAKGDISVEEFDGEEPAEAQHDETAEVKKELRMETREETVKRLYAQGLIDEGEYKWHMLRLDDYD